MPIGIGLGIAGLGSTIFGALSGSNGPGAQSSTQTQQTNLPPALNNYLNWSLGQNQNLFNQAQNIYNAGGMAPVPQMGAAPLSADISGAASNIRGLQNAGQANLQQANAYAQQAAHAYGQTFTPTDVSTTSYNSPFQVGNVSSQSLNTNFDPRSVTTGALNRYFTPNAASTRDLNQYYTPNAASTGQFSNRSAAQYMNPFIEQALQPQLQDIQHQLAAQQIGNNSNAIANGAFGGDRAAVTQQEAQRNANELMSNVIGQGYANAYNTAGQMFTADQARSLQAQGMNQQAGQSAYLGNAGQFNTNQARGLQAQGMNQQAGQAAYLGNAGQYNTDAARALQAQMQNQNMALQAYGMNAGFTEQDMARALQAQVQNQNMALQGWNANANQFDVDQARQLQAGIQNQNMGLLAYNANANQFNTDQARMLQAAGLEGGLGQQTMNMGLQQANALAGVGQLEQQQQQNALNVQYQNQMAQRNWPYQNFGFLQGALNSNPTGIYGQSTSTTTPGPNMFSQIGGGLLAAGGLSGGSTATHSEGGPIVGYADGGDIPISDDHFAGNILDDSGYPSGHYEMHHISGMSDRPPELHSLSHLSDALHNFADSLKGIRNYHG